MEEEVEEGKRHFFFLWFWRGRCGTLPPSLYTLSL